MKMPPTYTDKNETGCCPIPNVDAWNDIEVVFENKAFIRMYTRSFLFVPLNMGKIMTQLQELAEHSGATMPATEGMILSRDMSPWKAEQLYAVSKPVEGADMVQLSGTYISKVFEGPYKDAAKWHTEMQNAAAQRGGVAGDVYFFYTTCPKCAKHYGKNYVIGLAKIS